MSNPIENPSIPLSEAMQLWLGGRANGGFSVTPTSALGLPAVFRAVRLVSSKVARLPFQVYMKQGSVSVEDEDHPADLWIDSPSSFFGWFTLVQTLIAHAMLQGNGVCTLPSNTAFNGETVILDPLATRLVTASGQILYETWRDGKRYTLLPENCLHIKNLSSNGMWGYSICDLLHDALSVSGNLQQFADKSFENGTSPRLIVELPPGVKDTEALTEKKKKFKQSYAGPQNAAEAIWTTAGTKITPLPLDLEQYQFLASREFDLITLANLTGVPASKLGAKVNTSYSSLESEERAFLSDCIEEWLSVIVEECTRKLLTTAERRSESRWFDFDRSALIQTDVKTARQILYDDLSNGVRTLNQVLDELNLPLVDTDIGDVHRMPSNLAILEKLVEEPAPVAQPSVQDPEQLNTLMNVDLKRQFTRLEKAIGAKKDLAEHQEHFREALPIVDVGKIDTFFARVESELVACLPEQMTRERLGEIWTYC